MIALNQTSISKDFENKTIFVTRQFDAPPSLVWRAWTEAELLDQWWAPHPWKTITESMDFSVGGMWLYSMNGPEGEKSFCRADYTKIIPQKTFWGDDAFCDADAKPDPNFPVMHWKTDFIGEGDTTMVEVTLGFDNIEGMNTIVEMGFEQGFTAAHGNLDQLLKTL
jgi:uncharacterized protein YndB with AHSA1/START domain